MEKFEDNHLKSEKKLGTPLEQLNAMSEVEVETLIKGMLIHEEVTALSKKDIEVIVSAAKQSLERGEHKSVQDAIVASTSGRLEAKKLLPDEAEIYVKNIRGEIIARDKDSARAMKAAVEMKKGEEER